MDTIPHPPNPVFWGHVATQGWNPLKAIKERNQFPSSLQEKQTLVQSQAAEDFSFTLQSIHCLYTGLHLTGYPFFCSKTLQYFLKC